ncbi:MAG TPA: 2,3-bisphosphoglycerate-dependent phosphoglycerate mutase, partial [Planctomycetaceae bacterium]|nr:2,3-bisphosphoglycerate-dependent phosphoglycerate mutase [Planctomycetaceae bacterium]
LGRLWVPVHKNWRLNERHYGALQGQSKPETIAAKGEEQVHRWRRSFQVRPPALDDDDPRHPRFDPRYARLAPELLPCTESLEDVLQRVLPYWYDAVVPDILAGTGVMIAAHGNTLRALMMHLARISAEDIAEFEIPVASPILCSLDENLRAADYTFLGAS